MTRNPLGKMIINSFLKDETKGRDSYHNNNWLEIEDNFKSFQVSGMNIMSAIK